ncbi:MAG: hypothetical protein HGA49_09015 [Eubacteriaceae bacterium]|nr:hypothetical protein [Eubacteriaceae bacterium]
MLCDNCKERPASVHITKIINGEKKEVHLCDQCTSLQEVYNNAFSLKNFITNFIGVGSAPVQDVSNDDYAACDSCGMSFEAFKKYGKLGCENCYDSFEPLLKPLIKRMHGKERHTGKIIRHGGMKLKLKRDIEDLSYKLKKAIEREDYEQAAVYRDKIKLMNSAIEEPEEVK